MLYAVGRPTEAHSHLGKKRGNGGTVLRLHARAENRTGNRAINRARIYIYKSQRLRGTARHGAFSGARRAVDRDTVIHHGSLPFQSKTLYILSQQW